MTMIPTEQELTVVSEAEMKLWKFLKGKSGPFNTALFETIFHADYCNLKNLNLAFPEEVEVVRKFKTEPNFFDHLNEAIHSL